MVNLDKLITQSTLKTKLHSLFIGLVLLINFLQAQTCCAALSFTVTPSAVSNTYVGTITLQIGGLTNGEVVAIKKYLDLNTNGVVDATDLMVRDFQLTSGQSGAMVIGGVTNVNVPFNSNTNTNAITTTLNFQNGQFMETLVGQYLFVVSCATGQVTNSFAVTNSYPQQFTGTVLSGGNPVPNAVVLLLPAAGRIDNAPTPGAVANNSGVYTLPALAGTYALAAYKTNYVTPNITAANLILSNGQNFTTNLSLVAATESISGKVIDAATSNGLTGVLVIMASSSGEAFCYTDTNGNFTNGVTPDQWGVNGEDASVGLVGYVGFNNGVPVNAASGSVPNVVVPENKATALFYGYITNNFGNPLPGFQIEAEDIDNDIYDSFGTADANGYYVTAALGGLSVYDSYGVNLGSDYLPTNYVFSYPFVSFSYGNNNLATNTAVMANFTGILATNYITGWLKDNHGIPIAGVQIYDSEETPINGIYYEGNGAITDSNGNYVLNVCNGTWGIGVSTSKDTYFLPTNYVSPAGQTSMISNNNTVVDFTATNLLFPQVTTTTLPNGTNGVAYNQSLAASYGHPPYAWTNSSGALPPGLTLAVNGVISGTPTNNGTYSFSVQVTDAMSETATQPLTLNVFGAPSVVLQPTNSSVTVTVGSNATFSVSVSGIGPFSYQWQVNGTNLPNGIITTVAGNGTNAYSGDGGAATNAELSYPWGATVDATGNLFVADNGNNRIRKVGINGIITTVAGNGTASYSGDGGAATNAELNGPAGVCIDVAGNLFIADQNNTRVRKVGTNGIITTVAGNGTASFSGDGGAATNAELKYPWGVAVDMTGNLFIVDYGNNRIRKVSTNGIITTVAGNGTASFSGDGSAATNAELNGPTRVCIDFASNLFIADRLNNRIRKVGTNGIITTVAGNGTYGYSGDGGTATNAELRYPSGVSVDTTGNVFIADMANNVIRAVDTNGIITTVAGNGYGAGGSGAYSGDGGAATNAELDIPSDVILDSNGNLFFADIDNYRIRKVVNPGFVSGPAFILNNVGAGNAGAYDVVVTGAYGSITSSVVNLSVTLPPLSAPQITGGGAYFSFQLSGPAGSNYVLQVSTNLSNWSSVSTSTIPLGGTVTVSNATTGFNRRFYRVYVP